jgi:4-methyl-5(b-hydroxyethyl)-thiazole monophosphate biosynthesis
MIFVHLAEGFEEIEAVTVVDLLRRVDLESYFVSISGSKFVKGAHGITYEADFLFEEADYSKCEMIVLPGGLPGAYNLREHEGLREKIQEFALKEKALAAICAAPLVFGDMGILKGVKATIYPGMEAELKGAEPLNFPVVRDCNIITSQGPATAMKFAIAIVEYFKGKEVGDELAQGLLMK